MPYGPWMTLGPLSNEDATWVGISGDMPSRYSVLNATGGINGHTLTTFPQWTLQQSLAAHGALQYPHEYLDGRLCALYHSSEGEEGGSGANWDPGECDPLLGAPNAEFDSGAAFVGTETSFSIPSLPLIPASYQCITGLSRAGWTFDDPIGFGDEADRPYLSVPLTILAQIPGWFDAVSAHFSETDYHLDPQVEVLNVDLSTALTVPASQPFLTQAASVSAHRTTITPIDTVTPTSGLGAVELSAAPGGTSDPVEFPGIEYGDSAYWDIASSRVIDQLDPGQEEQNLIEYGFTGPALWTIRVRFLLAVEPVLRWRQRDDGLGVGGARRHKGGTSIQVSKRHRGYR